MLRVASVAIGRICAMYAMRPDHILWVFLPTPAVQNSNIRKRQHDISHCQSLQHNRQLTGGTSRLTDCRSNFITKMLHYDAYHFYLYFYFTFIVRLLFDNCY